MRISNEVTARCILGLLSLSLSLPLSHACCFAFRSTSEKSVRRPAAPRALSYRALQAAAALSVAITGRHCPEYRYRARALVAALVARPLYVSPSSFACARVIRKVHAIAEIVAPATRADRNTTPGVLGRFSVLESETFRGSRCVKLRNGGETMRRMTLLCARSRNATSARVP